MGCFKFTEIDTVECPVRGNLLRCRKAAAAVANKIFGFLHVHPLRTHRSGKSASYQFMHRAANGGKFRTSQTWRVPKSVGQLGGFLIDFGPAVVGLQPRIPLFELLTKGAIKDASSGLQHQMGARP